jgi:hypothetical protein
LLGLETLWAINTITTPRTNETQLTPKPVATMYEIAATVTTAVPTELKLTGNWPVDWLQAPGIRSIEIQCKLLANESLGSPLVALREEEILGNRANWPNLQLGDRVIVRCFFPRESR